MNALGTIAALLSLFLIMAPASQAATYTFADDTVGQTPANVSVGAGSFDVQDEAPLGKSMRAVSQTGVIAAANFSSFASSSDQSVVWKQAYSSTLSRGGFTLRSQAADTGVANSAGAKQGYLFHVYDSGSVYIWKVGPSSYTALWSGSLAKAEPRWYKATAIGTQLAFSYSDDGSTYTSLASVSDATYTGGTVQYTAGYGGSVGIDYVDDIVITNLDTDLTAPSIQTLSPADNASGASPSANLVITFTEPVDAETGLVSLHKASDGSLVEAIDVAGAQVTGTGTSAITINPASALDSSTAYYVLVAATAFDDASGNGFAGIAATSTWNFTTADVGAPALLSVSPQDGATDVATSTGLSLSFDEAVDAETGSVTIRKASDDTVVEAIDVAGGQVSGSGTASIVIDPSADLAPGTAYYVQVDASAFDDASGNGFAGIADALTWNFSTAPAEEGDVEEERTHSARPTSVGSRIQNLIRIGNADRARELMQEYPGLYGNPVRSERSGACSLPPVARALRTGAEGEDVRQLQKLLNCLGFALAEAGAGSLGNETTTFSVKTYNALVRFQEQHAADILAPLGLVSGTGIFGELSRAKAESLVR